MNKKCLACVLLILLGLNAFVYAQDEDLDIIVDTRVDKMKTVLNLSESQEIAIRPIIKDYLTKRNALLQEVAGEGIVDHVAIKETMKKLKEIEYQHLSKILSQDQMNKWIDKENLMAVLNPDGVESTVDDGATITAEGANFKF